MYKLKWLELLTSLNSIGVDEIEFLYLCGFENPYKVRQRLVVRETINQHIKDMLDKGIMIYELDSEKFFKEVGNDFFLGKI